MASQVAQKQSFVRAPTVTDNCEKNEDKDDDYLTTGELARWLKVNERTPEGWRTRGTGPPYIKLNDRVRYSRRVVREWMNERQIDPTEA